MKNSVYLDENEKNALMVISNIYCDYIDCSICPFAEVENKICELSTLKYIAEKVLKRSGNSVNK